MTGPAPNGAPTDALRYAQLGKPALGRSFGRTALALSSLVGGTVACGAAVANAPQARPGRWLLSFPAR